MEIEAANIMPEIGDRDEGRDAMPQIVEAATNKNEVIDGQGNVILNYIVDASDIVTRAFEIIVDNNGILPNLGADLDLDQLSTEYAPKTLRSLFTRNIF